MSNSYDSVTAKRRPVVRSVLAAVAAITIFGASMGAAQSIDPDNVSVVAAEASLSLPAQATASEAAPITVEPAEERLATPVVPTTTVAPTTSTSTTSTTTSTTLVATDVDVPQGFAAVDPAELGLGAADVSRDAIPAAPSEELLELVAKIEEKDRQIAVLSEQLGLLRQAQIENEATAQGTSDVVSLSTKTRYTAEENAAAMDLWRAGYVLGGGRNLPSFENVILPCESGSQPNPDTAVGRTNDWGRSQINRPTWETRFESLTGADFETGIVNPTLNGFMAAHVEQEQGLSAWTCWRKR